MIRKKLVYMSVFLAMLFFIYDSSCFSSATVNCNTLTKITDSKDALIGINNDIPVDIVKGKHPGIIKITNNMHENITLCAISSVGELFNTLPIIITVGSSLDIPIALSKDSSFESGLKNVSFSITWNGGKSEINLPFVINVTEYDPIKDIAAISRTSLESTTTKGSISIETFTAEGSASIELTTPESVSADIAFSSTTTDNKIITIYDNDVTSNIHSIVLDNASTQISEKPTR